MGKWSTGNGGGAAGASLWGAWYAGPRMKGSCPALSLIQMLQPGALGRFGSAPGGLLGLALHCAPCASQQLRSLSEWYAARSRYGSMHGATYHSSPLAAAAAASPPRLLVVHPGSQPEASLQEALRLGESYAGAGGRVVSSWNDTL